MGVVERIVAHAERLTSTERKIAEVLAGEPQTIAFGTVAQVASRAGTSGPSVVRLAVKLGYEGFVDLQADVQSELARQLGPARDRIRQRPPSDLLARVQAAEQDNVLSTLDAINPRMLDESVARLADRRRRVWVLAGEVMSPIGSVLAGQLGQLRDGVAQVGGSEVAVSRALAGLEAEDTLVAVDIRRYERSLVSVVRWAAERGAAVIALTDSPLSPLASAAEHTFFVSARGIGPFDSLTGGIALANTLVTAVAVRLRQSAPARLDAIEAAWTATGALVAEPGGTNPPPGAERIANDEEVEAAG
ncbi:MAG TPA: MurR/RpiR family transcriptional regulator [Acidimicrobiales bacterium]|nr:MurR/RpiR family transcriptional regulator [Acidimicrobiales bacterium]